MSHHSSLIDGFKQPRSADVRLQSLLRHPQSQLRLLRRPSKIQLKIQPRRASLHSRGRPPLPPPPPSTSPAAASFLTASDPPSSAHAASSILTASSSLLPPPSSAISDDSFLLAAAVSHGGGKGEEPRSAPQAPPQRVKNEIHDLPAIFDPESSEWKMMSPLLPVLKDVFEEPGKAPGEHEYLSDWIAVSECARCLIKFLSRCDLIEECDKLPSRIDRLKEACQGSSFDYTALIRYAEGIYADAADLRGKGYNALKDNEEETVEDLRGQFADLTLIKYRRQLKELTVQRAQEQGAQFATTLERSISQVVELKRRIGLAEQLQQERLAVLDVRRREEADAVKKKKETQGKFSDIALYAYQEQRRQVLSRAKMVSFMEPGPTPLSLARDSD